METIHFGQIIAGHVPMQFVWKLYILVKLLQDMYLCNLYGNDTFWSNYCRTCTYAICMETIHFGQIIAGHVPMQFVWKRYILVKLLQDMYLWNLYGNDTFW